MMCLIAPIIIIVMLSPSLRSRVNSAKHPNGALQSYQRPRSGTERCFTEHALSAVEGFSMTLRRYLLPRTHLLYHVFCFLHISCGSSPTITLPTAHIVRAGRAATPTPPTPSPRPTATLRPETTSAPLPSATPALDPSLGPPLDQYHAWMQEARALHPYSEPLDIMWQ